MGDEQFLKKRTEKYQRAWDVAQELAETQCKFEGSSTFLDECYELIPAMGEKVQTVVRVLDADPVKLSSELEDKKNISAVIAITGCQNKWGGGVDSGQVGIEEDLCRRSNLFYALKKCKKSYQKGAVLPTTAFYCTEVDVFMTPELKITKETTPIDVISVMVTKSPSTIGYADGKQLYEEDSDRRRMVQCLTNVFRIAEMNEYDAVIINQIGIELDRHPVHGIAEVLNEVIAKSTIKYVFYIYPKPADTDITDVRTYRSFFAEVDNNRPKEEVLAEFNRELEEQKALQREREREMKRKQKKKQQREEREREKELRRRRKERLAEAKKEAE